MSKWNVSDQSIYDENGQQIIEANEWYMRDKLQQICDEHNENIQLKDELHDLQVHSLKIENGEINMSVSGENAKLFFTTLVQIFKQNGGKNFLCQTLKVQNGSEKYSVTIQNCNGNLTPAEKLENQKQTIEIYRKHWLDLYDKIIAEIDNDGCCRLVVTKDEALKMKNIFEKLE